MPPHPLDVHWPAFPPQRTCSAYSRTEAATLRSCRRIRSGLWSRALDVYLASPGCAAVHHSSTLTLAVATKYATAYLPGSPFFAVLQHGLSSVRSAKGLRFSSSAVV